MAKKRMFTMNIVDSDAFLDMPLTSQALYFHLNMRADDDGFISNPKRIMRTVGCTEDDLKLLIAKRFILVFENGVIVIKHWRMHNTIRKDRYTPTVYQEEMQELLLKSNSAYSMTSGNPVIARDSENGNQMATKWQPNGNPVLDIGLDIGLDIDKDILYNNNLNVIIHKWLTYKAEMKKPYTETSKKALLDEIAEKRKNHSDEDIERVINLSISNNYSGIAWEKLPKGRLSDIENW